MDENYTIYEAPEIFELGEAGELTLGDALKPYPDNCGCKWSVAPDLEF